MKGIKKAALAAAGLLLALGLTGCASVQDALHELGSAMQTNDVETPQNSGGDIDWSFVPVVRDMAVKTFTEGVPDARVVDTAVVTKNGAKSRVIVVITYERNGKQGDYGFDYRLNDAGEYELKRYGDGVSANDI